MTTAAQFEPRGEALAILERNGGLEQLRVVDDDWLDRRFVNLRVWFLSNDGEWKPTKRGVSVRIHELETVICALDKAASRYGIQRRTSSLLANDAGCDPLALIRTLIIRPGKASRVIA